MTAPTLREEQTALTRERIMQGLQRLLVEGQDVTFAGLAVSAGVQERTIYRHFANRTALYEAFWYWLHDKLGPITATTLPELKEQAANVLANFDEFDPLIREMIRNPEGIKIRSTVNDWRTGMFLSIVEQETEGLDAGTQRKVAALCGLMFSAPAWQMLKDYWGMNGAEAGETAQLGIQLLIDAAKTRINPTTKSPARLAAAKSTAKKE